jgi:hypothetical protein
MCPLSVSRFFLGHCFGVKPTPGGTALSCFPGSAQNKFENNGTERRTNFFQVPPKKQPLGAWESAHSLGFARCDPSKIGKFKNGDTKCTRTK